MGNSKVPIERRAWNLLRLAFLWARKGGVFKRGLMMDLRLLPNYLKSLCHNRASDSIHYREREFSFDETPIIHFKMHRPASMRCRIPCLNAPSVDFDFNDDIFYNDNARKSFLPSRNERGRGEEEEDFNNCKSEDDNDDERRSSAVISYREEPQEDEDEEGGIDLRAEEFIAKFYEQMKLQRQNSYLQYHEMLNRGAR